MFCIKCGKEIPDESDFCPKCGSSQNPTAAKAVEEEEKIKCPKCGSTQITANKKGFSAGKAVGGALLTGGIGLLAGLHGAGKIKLTCLKCGHKFEPGALAKPAKPDRQTIPQAVTPPSTPMTEEEKKTMKKNLLGCLVILIVISILVYMFFFA